ncbi:hypothetical protein [Niabella ginsenosidivorans]|uniref:hypothetical protein n=1 Tax=Niabella ginsenosidivorans TaxID=1176587 RepID=UPI0012EDC924|nr:hypothetical protein [Niabella ginsenosidivorans]
MEEAQQLAYETVRLTNRVAYKAQQLKESDPNSCKNCKYKHRCPLYDPTTGEKAGDCLKMPAYAGKNGLRGYLISKICGPVAPDETGSYEFEYVWPADIVDYYKINNNSIYR